MLPPGSLVAVPDLPWEGPARLLANRGNTVVIRFLATGAEMTQPEKSVSRYLLLPGTRIAVEAGGQRQEAEVARLQPLRDPKTGLLVYPLETAAGPQRLREDAVAAVHPPRDPAEQLATVAFHDLRPGAAEPWGPLVFEARERLLAWRDEAWERTRGVVGLAGARVVPLPHQLLTARTCLADRQVRFLLADEVGLGKTIEAGLVVQSLLAMKPDLRVLAIVPGALVSQWFLELYVKFGGRRFLMLDHERLTKLPGNPWKDEPLVIASARAVEEMDPKQALRLAQSQWDVLIVDECHRMQPGGVLYKRVAVLSKNTPHVLLLSATPGRSHPEAWLGLLALLQPQVHRLEDLPRFERRLEAHAAVAALMERTLAEDADAADLARRWPALLPGDARLAALAAALPAGGAAARTALAEHVRAHHRLDHRVVRHRRQVLARLSAASGVKGLALAERALERCPYKPDAAELAAAKALAAYRVHLVAAHDGAPPPRLAHWLLQLELALACHPAVLERLLAMRQTIVAEPEEYEEYRRRAQKGETLAAVLRSDLSEAEASSHVAVSAACHVDPGEEEALDAAHAAALAWDKAAGRKGTARLQALVKRLAAFWSEHPREKVLVFTLHSLAVIPLHDALAAAFPGSGVETFGAHQDTVAREEAVRRFRDDDDCPLLVCDPLGGEGRNFQFVSAIAHHDLPWSVAAVEQRIGRVDRLGRDGEVPSWVFAAEHAAAVDGAWADILEHAVGVFTRSASGLEFASDALEGRALQAVLGGGAAGLRTERGALAALVAEERAAVEAQEDAAFHHDAATYAAAARDAAAVAASRAPVDALLRWLRAIGGSARRQDEAPQPWQIRARWHDQPETGTFDRGTALAHPQLAFLAQGNATVDRLCQDAAEALWCRATAIRRKPTAAVPRWEGVRATLELAPDLAPLAAAGLPLASLRRLFLAAPPWRATVCVRIDGDAAAVEADPAVLALATAAVDGRTGDACLSQAASRDLWTRLSLGGKLEQVLAWQDGVRRACAAAAAEGAVRLPAARTAALAALRAANRAAGEQAALVAASAAERFGAGDPAAAAAAGEAAFEARLGQALEDALAGARLEIASAAYLHIG